MNGRSGDPRTETVLRKTTAEELLEDVKLGGYGRGERYAEVSARR